MEHKTRTLLSIAANTSASCWVPGLNRRLVSEDDQALSAILQMMLGESPQRANDIVRAWHRHRNIVANAWQTGLTESFDRTFERANNIQMADEDLLRHFLDSTDAGTVLLSIHMGDYLHTLLKILSLSKPRKIVVLRQKSWSEAEQLTFAKASVLGHEVMTVRHGPSAAKQVIKALRAGAMAVLFCDLPQRWGVTLPVTLFDRQFQWVSGPIQLSMLGRSCVIPFFSYEENKVLTCDLRAVRDYSLRERKPEPMLKDFVAAELQCMATFAEQMIRRHSAQWNHWHLLPEMMIEESRYG